MAEQKKPTIAEFLKRLRKGSEFWYVIEAKSSADVAQNIEFRLNTYREDEMATIWAWHKTVSDLGSKLEGIDSLKENIYMGYYHRAKLMIATTDYKLSDELVNHTALEAIKKYDEESAYPLVFWQGLSLSVFNDVLVQYISNEAQFNPNIDSFTNDEIKEIYERVKKDSSALKGLSLNSKNALLDFLIIRDALEDKSST